MAGVGDWSSDGRTVVAATAHKGLVELEVTAQHAVDASEAASFSAAASDAGSTAKVTTSHSMLPTPLDSNSQSDSLHPGALEPYSHVCKNLHVGFLLRNLHQVGCNLQEYTIMLEQMMRL